MTTKFAPDWYSYEVEEALRAITDSDASQRRKKQHTVLRMAQAAAEGRSLDSVFEEPGTCAKSTWYGDKRKKRTGWRDDSAIAHAVEIATDRALWWMRYTDGRGVQAGLEELAVAVPLAVRQAVNFVTHGQAIVRRGGQAVAVEASPTEILKAALGIMDRASATTAAKGSREVTGKDGAPLVPAQDLSKLSMEELLTLRELAAKAEQA